MSYRNVVVFTAAAIGVGAEIEVELVRIGASRGVRVRDLATGVLYGGSSLFDEEPAFDLLGHREDYRSPRYAEGSEIVERFRGHVRECVVANTPQNEGMAPSTSFLVELDDAGAKPYR